MMVDGPPQEVASGRRGSCSYAADSELRLVGAGGGTASAVVPANLGAARGGYDAREAVVLYGQEKFSYLDLIELVNWAARQPPLGIGSFFIHREWLDWRRGSPNVRKGMTMDKTFFDLMDHASLLDCGDPRDHVYALLGHPLAQRADGGGLIIKPDYTKDLMELYLKVAILSLEMVGLRALITVEHTEESPLDGFPSWINRWHIRGPTNNISRLPNKVFYAGGLIDSRPLIEDRCLTLNGSTVDGLWKCFRLRCTSYLFTAVDAEDPGREYNLTELYTFLTEDGVRSAYGEEKTARLQALCTTLRAAHPNDDPLHHLYGFLRLLRGDVTSVQLQQGSSDDNSTIMCWQRMSRIAYGRSFAVSEKGRYCLVPKIAQPGDQICVVHGLDVPLVMRLSGSQRKLLGEAYVYGLMRGEAMEMLQRGELVEEVLKVV